MKMLREIPDDPFNSDWSNSCLIPKKRRKLWGLVGWVESEATQLNLPAADDVRCACRARLFYLKIIIEKKLPDLQSA